MTGVILGMINPYKIKTVIKLFKYPVIKTLSPVLNTVIRKLKSSSRPNGAEKLSGFIFLW